MAMTISNIWTWAIPKLKVKLSSIPTTKPIVFISTRRGSSVNATNSNALHFSSQPHRETNTNERTLSFTNSETFRAIEKPKYWKPMCLYYTQNRCTKMDDPEHLEKFSHCYSSRLQVGSDGLKNLQPQQVDYFLVLDLEGKVEILEFPVVMIDAHSLEFVDAFHRFVRPIKMSEKRVEEYINGKYGKLRLDRVWHDTSIPFAEMLQQFENWLRHHQLWEKGALTLHHAAFVTCGNWDVKTKIPEQCRVSGIKLPPYFMEWINIKDVYLNFYNHRLFYDSTAISMVCRIPVRQPSKEAHGKIGIDLLMDLLLLVRAKSSRKSPSGAVKEAGQHVDEQSSESSNQS